MPASQNRSSPRPDNSYTGQHSEEIVTYRPYMLSLLRRLQQARAMISIRPAKEELSYNSIILDTINEEACFYLDELSPSEGHKKLKKGSRIHFDGRLRGVRLTFDSKILAIEEDNSIAMYRVALPDQLHYFQRRRHYRAIVQDDLNMGISLPLALQKRLSGNIVDISASGFCTRLDYEASTYLQEEQTIADAVINLPGSNNRIICDIAVRSIRAYPDKGYSLIGTEITGISTAARSHVERVVAKLDRDQRRRVTA